MGNGSLGNSCKDAGGHFNPGKKNHGDVNADERHKGDFGNIVADSQGDAKISIVRQGGNLAELINRAIVVHAGVDDLGQGGASDSLTTGNAGARLDCCVIELKEESSSGTTMTTTIHSVTLAFLFFIVLI